LRKSPGGISFSKLVPDPAYVFGPRHVYGPAPIGAGTKLRIHRRRRKIVVGASQDAPRLPDVLQDGFRPGGALCPKNRRQKKRENQDGNRAEARAAIRMGSAMSWPCFARSSAPFKEKRHQRKATVRRWYPLPPGNWTRNLVPRSSAPSTRTPGRLRRTANSHSASGSASKSTS